jgi:hypothetical protein
MQSRGAAMICNADVSTGEGAMQALRGSAFGLATDIGTNNHTMYQHLLTIFLQAGQYQCQRHSMASSVSSPLLDA